MNKVIGISVFLVLLVLLVSCSAPSSSDNKAAAVQPAEVVMDLNNPPPGSKATPDKWAGFDEEKKTDSWEKYIADLQSGETASVETVEEPVKRPGKSSIVSVVTGELTKGAMNISYYGLGELKAGDEIRISPAINGTVASIYVNEGDFVETGDLLFSLDSSDLVKSIERAGEKWDAELELSELRLSESANSYETARLLYSKDLVTRLEFDKARQTWEEAKISHDKVQLSKTAEMENLQDDALTTLVLSSVRGYVGGITFNRGEIINSADYVEIIDIEKIIITIQVPENIITKVKTGSLVKAKQASAPEYQLEGKVIGKGVVSDNNRTYEVVAEFENSDQKLLPGMLMEAEIQMVHVTSRFIVPRECIVSTGSDQFLYFVKDDKARKVPVETGQSRGKFIQVSGAFEEGDHLVLQGQTYLKNGAAVNITETRAYLPEVREF